MTVLGTWAALLLPLVSSPDGEVAFGGLYVTSNPSGLEVILDGVSTEHGTPLRLAKVRAGPHVVELRRAGTRTATQRLDVEVRPGKEAVVVFSDDLHPSRSTEARASVGEGADPLVGVAVGSLVCGAITAGAAVIVALGHDGGLDGTVVDVGVLGAVSAVFFVTAAATGVAAKWKTPIPSVAPTEGGAQVSLHMGF